MYLKHHLAAEEVAIAKYCLNITHVRCSLFNVHADNDDKNSSQAPGCHQSNY